MGMSSYILDLEDKFQYEEVPNIVKDCDCVEEAINRSEEKRQKEWDEYYKWVAEQEELYKAQKKAELIMREL